MKYNVNSYSEADVLTTTDERDITLSKDSQVLIFQMFSKNIYSNPIGSVVREITSNCFDSHIEANVDAPVLIKKSIDKQTNTHYISFIDYGAGMSPDRIEKVFSVMFSSTKRNDNEQIGAFGLGSKTPLAYKRSTGFGEGEYDNSYFIITIFNKIKYSYQIYEGNNSPKISLLHSEPTKEHNGTEIRIPVLERDLNSFSKEMVRQLYYFENIVFEGFNNDENNTNRYDEALTNVYQIVRGKSFLFRGNDYSDYIHVCLGKVAYPIDYSVLGLNSNDYRLPLAIRFEVGDIGVTVSRESLDYNENTIKLLKKKLELVKKEITELITKQYSNVQTLADYFEVKLNFGKLNLNNGNSINVGNLILHSDINFSNFKYKLFSKMPSDNSLFSFFFKTKTFGKKLKRNRYSKTNYEFFGGYNELKNKTNILYINNEFVRKIVKQAYLKSKFDMYHIVEKRNINFSDIHSINDIQTLFNIRLDINNDEIKNLIIEMQDEYFNIVRKCATNYDELEIPENFIIDRKNNKSPNEIENISIPVQFVGASKYRINLKDLINYNSLIFYGNKEDESKLYQAYKIFCNLFDDIIPVTYYNNYNKCFTNRSDENKKSIMFIVLAENNLKYMQYCKKAYKIDQFFNKILYRKENIIKDYFQVNGIIEKYKQIRNLYTSDLFAKVDAKWSMKIKNIKFIFDNISKVYKNDNIGSMKESLSNYFDLNHIKMTTEQKKLEKQIDEVLFLQNANASTLNYIDLPYNLDGENNEELIRILQKVMIL